MAAESLLPPSSPSPSTPVHSPSSVSSLVRAHASAASLIQSSSVAVSEGTPRKFEIVPQKDVQPSGAAADAEGLMAFEMNARPLSLSPVHLLPRRASQRSASRGCREEAEIHSSAAELAEEGEEDLGNVPTQLVSFHTPSRPPRCSRHGAPQDDTPDTRLGCTDSSREGTPILTRGRSVTEEGGEDGFFASFATQSQGRTREDQRAYAAASSSAAQEVGRPPQKAGDGVASKEEGGELGGDCAAARTIGELRPQHAGPRLFSIAPYAADGEADATTPAGEDGVSGGRRTAEAVAGRSRGGGRLARDKGKPVTEQGPPPPCSTLEPERDLGSVPSAADHSFRSLRGRRRGPVPGLEEANEGGRKAARDARLSAAASYADTPGSSSATDTGRSPERPHLAHEVAKGCWARRQRREAERSGEPTGGSRGYCRSESGQRADGSQGVGAESAAQSGAGDRGGAMGAHVCCQQGEGTSDEVDASGDEDFRLLQRAASSLQEGWKVFSHLLRRQQALSRRLRQTRRLQLVQQKELAGLREAHERLLSVLSRSHASTGSEPPPSPPPGAEARSLRPYASCCKYPVTLAGGDSQAAPGDRCQACFSDSHNPSSSSLSTCVSCSAGSMGLAASSSCPREAWSSSCACLPSSSPSPSSSQSLATAPCGPCLSFAAFRSSSTSASASSASAGFPPARARSVGALSGAAASARRGRDCQAAFGGGRGRGDTRPSAEDEANKENVDSQTSEEAAQSHVSSELRAATMESSAQGCLEKRKPDVQSPVGSSCLPPSLHTGLQCVSGRAPFSSPPSSLPASAAASASLGDSGGRLSDAHPCQAKDGEEGERLAEPVRSLFFQAEARAAGVETEAVEGTEEARQLGEDGENSRLGSAARSAGRRAGAKRSQGDLSRAEAASGREWKRLKPSRPPRGGGTGEDSSLQEQTADAVRISSSDSGRSSADAAEKAQSWPRALAQRNAQPARTASSHGLECAPPVKVRTRRRQLRRIQAKHQLVRASESEFKEAHPRRAASRAAPLAVCGGSDEGILRLPGAALACASAAKKSGAPEAEEGRSEPREAQSEHERREAASASGEVSAELPCLPGDERKDGDRCASRPAEDAVFLQRPALRGMKRDRPAEGEEDGREDKRPEDSARGETRGERRKEEASDERAQREGAAAAAAVKSPQADAASCGGGREGRQADTDDMLFAERPRCWPNETAADSPGGTSSLNAEGGKPAARSQLRGRKGHHTARPSHRWGETAACAGEKGRTVRSSALVSLQRRQERWEALPKVRLVAPQRSLRQQMPAADCSQCDRFYSLLQSEMACAHPVCAGGGSAGGVEGEADRARRGGSDKGEVECRSEREGEREVGVRFRVAADETRGFSPRGSRVCRPRAEREFEAGQRRRASEEAPGDRKAATRARVATEGAGEPEKGRDRQTGEKKRGLRAEGSRRRRWQACAGTHLDFNLLHASKHRYCAPPPSTPQGFWDFNSFCSPVRRGSNSEIHEA
ncbi:hypothetical protein BESB_030310 [Besnoitia besnoiti]|uniref:Uncharacterized protein n=1 Tax=Besnoitia besnoiti TaxID=94643 RepID=A0A2A9M686_BESBE|nr:hypothetical protein BESB_030310 [Besnoitia besnoiti]PFH31157.1 hypothetical protein BESB_030310 [Besnoitia besnoiti]